MTQRAEIGKALYLLRAGTDHEVFLTVVRAYLLQHIETTEQMAELLQDLSSVNPPAFVEALQTLAGRPLGSARTDAADVAAELHALRSTIDGGSVASVKVAKVKTPNARKASSRKREKHAVSNPTKAASLRKSAKVRESNG